MADRVSPIPLLIRISDNGVWSGPKSQRARFGTDADGQGNATAVVPLVVLLGAGSADLIARLAPWLVLPRTSGVPSWGFVALAVLGIDAVDWIAHLGNHKITSLWRLHAVHH